MVLVWHPNQVTSLYCTSHVQHLPGTTAFRGGKDNRDSFRGQCGYVVSDFSERGKCVTLAGLLQRCYGPSCGLLEAHVLIEPVER